MNYRIPGNLTIVLNVCQLQLRNFITRPCGDGRPRPSKPSEAPQRRRHDSTYSSPGPQWTVSTVVSLTAPSAAPIVVVPVPVVEIAPVLSIIATVRSDELHATCPIRFSCVPSLNVPVAPNCCRAPKAIFGFAGLIVIELNVAFVTVNGATPTSPENAAVTVAVPGAFPVAKPNDPPALLTVTSDGFDDVHSAEFVTFCVVPSASVPVAFKLIEVPSATLPLPGEIVIAVTASTVRLAVLLTPPSRQVIVTEPFDTPVTIPIPLTVATVAAEDVQPATVSTCCVVPSLKFPMACNDNVEPGARPALAGVTVIDVSVAELTFSGDDPVTPPNAAEIVVEPDATPVATPMLPDALLMLAAAVLLLVHTTSCVMFCVLVSLKIPMAVKGCAISGAIVVLEGATTIEATVAVVTSSVAVPFTEPSVAVMVVAPLPTDCARPVVGAIVATVVDDELHVAFAVILRLLPSL